MPYSTSLRSVEDMKKFLDDLAAAAENKRTVAWQVPSGSARRIAWKIREAFHAIKTNKDDPSVAPYLILPAIFKVSERSSESVVARIRAPGAIRTVLIDEGFDPQEAGKIAETKAESREAHTRDRSALVDELLAPKREKNLAVGGVLDHFGIITAWNSNRTAAKLSFPDVDTTSGILPPIFRWAQKQDPQVLLIVPPGGTGLTLILDDPEMREYAWAPEE